MLLLLVTVVTFSYLLPSFKCCFPGFLLFLCVLEALYHKKNCVILMESTITNFIKLHNNIGAKVSCPTSNIGRYNNLFSKLSWDDCMYPGKPTFLQFSLCVSFSDISGRWRRALICPQKMKILRLTKLITYMWCFHLYFLPGGFPFSTA